MAILSYNEITQKKIIVFNGDPYKVLSSRVFRMQMRKPVNQTKLRHLVSGRVIENSFHQNESAPEAEIEQKDAIYLYTNHGESWFTESTDKKNRFSFPEGLVHDSVRWLEQNAPITALFYDEKPISISLPAKVEISVTEAPPAIKGNTATGGTKQVTLSSGANINVPLFVNAGDIVRVNTDTGEYVERVAKK
ncbi:MAG TPA: elongation factor P [Candidatus Kaiserbacteria bacterium]|nr:elongation factor P [Candidatus Kaiserbacteria bacterium]